AKVTSPVRRSARGRLPRSARTGSGPAGRCWSGPHGDGGCRCGQRLEERQAVAAGEGQPQEERSEQDEAPGNPKRGRRRAGPEVTSLADPPEDLQARAGIEPEYAVRPVSGRRPAATQGSRRGPGCP